MSRDAVLSAVNLTRHYQIKGGPFSKPATVKALNEATFELYPGQTLAVDFHGQSAAIRHTRFGAQVVKDGVVDALRDAIRSSARLMTHGQPSPSRRSATPSATPPCYGCNLYLSLRLLQ